MSDREHGFRDEAGAAIEHAARLRDENERLKAELAERKDAAPLDAANERAARLEAENERLKTALEARASTASPIPRKPAMEFEMPKLGWLILVVFGLAITYGVCSQTSRMPPIHTPVGQ